MSTHTQPQNVENDFSDLNPNIDMNNSNSTNQDLNGESTQTEDLAKNENVSDKANLMEFILKSEQEIQTLKEEANDWKSKSLKYAADLQNLEKHHLNATKEANKNTQKNLLKTILPFLNTLNLAFSYLPKTEDDQIQKFFETLKLSFQTLTQDLEKQEISLIIPEIGTEVNPNSMSVLNPEANSGDQVLVKNVVSVGLKIQEFVIVPASVMI